MTLRLGAVAVVSRAPAQQAAFWATMLDRALVERAGTYLLPGSPRQVALRFVPGGPASTVGGSEGTSEHPMHLHCMPADDADHRRMIDLALRIGGTHRDVGQRPDEQHTVLADAVGDAFCVIEPTNRYLAGCGPLGETTWAGSREVGLFYSAALDWPLVWDRDEETAIQSPDGGTKVAWSGTAYGGPLPDREYLELRSNDFDADVARLHTLGAASVMLEGGARVHHLTDPDGARFSVTADH